MIMYNIGLRVKKKKDLEIQMCLCVCVCVQILFEWFCQQILILKPCDLTKCLQFLINQKNRK